MAITEMERLRLHQHFKGSMGEELAATMMESLPPAGWGDVATKQDVACETARLRKDVDARFEVMEHKFCAVLHRELRIQTGAIAALVVALGALVNLF